MSNTVKTGSIFNVEEAQGTERARHETTAAQAQAEAPDSRVSHQVEENAEHLQEAATKAAQAAQGMGPELTGERDTSTAFDVLKSEAAQKTNAAASEGQMDFRMAKDTSASYLDQAKTLVESIAASAQDYLHGSTDPHAISEGDAVSSSQTSALSGTAQKYFASAQAAAQPHIDVAQSTLQPQVEKARETVEGYLGMHSSASPSDAVTPPSTDATTDAPLDVEDIAGLPYASTTTTAGAEERRLESNIV
ncbi:uncharacterized protein EDB93DRAFT_1247354 [Suillus bovinus]|uniref:uncharacterized protein n=1 Tax=Suillus bovinus TaxID=48563 RepID=UPI001B86DC46|nr:uncharacterized protein EDB93DRAFT_1247354 [Suillus bovinus]KAG2156651.1 hypothetical protein EDB93DRAFT_1247354 [Suillus bovinus]